MSTVLVHPAVTNRCVAVPERHARPRILIVRSCRMAQLLNAVVITRTKNRDAEIVVLSHRGYRHVLRAAGADRVIEVPGRRFGLLCLVPWTLKRLRNEGFSEIVIPQMTANAGAYMNLYQMVAALRPVRVTIVPGQSAPETFEGQTFVQHTVQQTCSGALGRWHKSVVARMLLAFLK